MRRARPVVWILGGLLWLSVLAPAMNASPADLTDSAWLAFDHFFSGLMLLEWWAAEVRGRPGGEAPGVPAVTADLVAAQEHFRRFEDAIAALPLPEGNETETLRMTAARRAARRIRVGIDDGIQRMRGGDRGAAGEISAARCASIADTLAFYDLTTADELFSHETFLDQRRGLERLYRWQRRFLERSRC